MARSRTTSVARYVVRHLKVPLTIRAEVPGEPGAVARSSAVCIVVVVAVRERARCEERRRIQHAVRWLRTASRVPASATRPCGRGQLGARRGRGAAHLNCLEKSSSISSSSHESSHSESSPAPFADAALSLSNAAPYVSDESQSAPVSSARCTRWRHGTGETYPRRRTPQTRRPP